MLLRNKRPINDSGSGAERRKSHSRNFLCASFSCHSHGTAVHTDLEFKYSISCVLPATISLGEIGSLALTCQGLNLFRFQTEINWGKRESGFCNSSENGASAISSQRTKLLALERPMPKWPILPCLCEQLNTPNLRQDLPELQEQTVVFRGGFGALLFEMAQRRDGHSPK